MRADLLHNYGVEKVTPVLKGGTVADVYRDVKHQGSLVRDQMQQKREENATKTRNRQREWARKANKRVEAKTLKAQEKKAETAAAERAIRL